MNFLDKQFGRLGNRMFHMAYVYSQFKDGLIPDIYLQDPIYFEKYADGIKRMYGEEIGFDERVAIHVRRGDYVGNPFYEDLWNSEYYNDARNLFPNDRFLIFSDDIGWVKSMWNDSRIDFSEGHTEEGDLKLMASCKSQIIANSSFSWWAAYLNPNPNKQVIYPKHWYTDGIERTKCPKDWICL